MACGLPPISSGVRTPSLYTYLAPSTTTLTFNARAATGATVAALCVYDMCKAVSHDIVVSEVRLLGKTGGKKDVGNGEAHAE